MTCILMTNDIYSNMAKSGYKNIEEVVEVAEAKILYGNSNLGSGIAISITNELFDTPIEKENFWSNVINYSYRSAQRKKARNQDLPFAPFEKWVLFLRVLKRSKTIFGDYTKAKSWLSKPDLQLEGKAPYDILGSYLGYERINHLLDKIEYSLPV